MQSFFRNLRNCHAIGIIGKPGSFRIAISKWNGTRIPGWGMTIRIPGWNLPQSA